MRLAGVDTAGIGTATVNPAGRRHASERGSVTAEFAIALPAFLMVLVLAIGAIMLATQRLSLSAAAFEVARLEARGDSAAAGARIAALGPGVDVSRHSSGVLHCVTLESAPAAGLLQQIGVAARGCAASVQGMQP